MMRHLAVTAACLNFITLTFKALGRNHIVSTIFEAIAMLCFRETVGVHVSAPVLSWLFIAQGMLREAFPVHQLSPNVNPLDTTERQAASAQLKSQDKGPSTKSSEPILLPKLRIYFADFPCLLLPCAPEAADLGDLMRLWVRSGVQINLSFGFSWAVGSVSDTSDDNVLYQPINRIDRQSDFREKGG